MSLKFIVPVVAFRVRSLTVTVIVDVPLYVTIAW